MLQRLQQAQEEANNKTKEGSLSLDVPADKPKRKKSPRKKVKKKKKKGSTTKAKPKKKKKKKKKVPGSSKTRRQNPPNMQAARALFKAVSAGDLETVKKIVEEGINKTDVGGVLLDDPASPSSLSKKITSLHLAATGRFWDILDLLIYRAEGNVNALDSDDNSVLLWAVRSGADVPFLQKLIKKGADIFLSNKEVQTPIFYAKNDQVGYLIDVFKERFPELLQWLSMSDEDKIKHAVASLYSLSFQSSRRCLGDTVPPQLWQKLVSLIRFDPGRGITTHPPEVVSPALIAFHNFAIDETYGTLIGSEPGAFAFLFGLTCKHSIKYIQQLAANAIFSLSRHDANKEIIATKWFKVLIKLFNSSSNPEVQSIVYKIVSETSIGNDSAKEMIISEIGESKLVSLLSSPNVQISLEATRILTNITKNNQQVQESVATAGGFTKLLNIAKQGEATEEQILAVFLAITNMLPLLENTNSLDKKTLEKMETEAQEFFQVGITAIEKYFQNEAILVTALTALKTVSERVKELGGIMKKTNGVAQLLKLLTHQNTKIRLSALETLHTLLVSQDGLQGTFDTEESIETIEFASASSENEQFTDLANTVAGLLNQT